MYINQDNQKNWTPKPGMSELIIQKDSFKPGEIAAFLQRMGEQLAVLPNKHLDLIFEHELTADELLILTNYINSQADVFPIAKLELRIAESSMETPQFKLLCSALNSTNIQQFKLNIDLTQPQSRLNRSNNDAESIAEILQQQAATAHYPITVHDASKQYGDHLNSGNMLEFNQNNIKNIQAYNFHKLNAQLQGESIAVAPPENNPEFVVPETTEPVTKKIRMKALINPNNTHNKAFDNHLKIEMIAQQKHEDQEQFDLEQEQQQQQQLEDVLQLDISEDFENMAVYEGEKLGYDQIVNRFNNNAGNEKEIYAERIKLLRTELLANIPKAIKYLSPNAAMAIFGEEASYSATKPCDLDALATLNEHNLPQNFILKKTQAGELVLDYDLYAADKKYNPYIPKAGGRYSSYAYRHPIDGDRLYEQFKPQVYKSNVNNDSMSLRALDTEKHYSLWCKFGSGSLQLLETAFNNCDQQHPGFIHLLMRAYFDHINWDTLLDNADFISCINKISAYDQTKFKCLQKFLERTGKSQHQLTATLAAFEDFWSQWEAMAEKAKLEPAAILSNWSTPEGGNPVVYMERLLIILKNTRDVKEQCECLDGIELNNYGAYYASKHEGFKLVSKEMQFNYDPVVQNSKEFNAAMPVYRVDPLQLLEYVAGCGIEPEHIQRWREISWSEKFNSGYHKYEPEWDAVEINDFRAQHPTFPILYRGEYKGSCVYKPLGYTAGNQSGYIRNNRDAIVDNAVITQEQANDLLIHGVDSSESADMYLYGEHDCIYYIELMNPAANPQATDPTVSAYPHRYLIKKIRPLESITIDKYLPQACRVIGQQAKSIELKKYATAAEQQATKIFENVSLELEKSVRAAERKVMHRLPRGANDELTFKIQKPINCIAKSVVTTLFFVAHPRYQDALKVDAFIELLNKQIYASNNVHVLGNASYYVFEELLTTLKEIYPAKVYLNMSEAKLIATAIYNGKMTDKQDDASTFFYFRNDSKEVSNFHRVARHLRDNTYATFRFLKFATKPNKYLSSRINLKRKGISPDDYHATKNPFGIVWDDTIIKAEYLAADQDGAVIESVYRDNLLLFSAMIAFDAFNHGFKYSHWADGKTMPFFVKVKPYFLKAATDPKPNNLDTALNLLFTAQQPFLYSMFFNAFEKIEALTEYDSARVVQILEEHKFELESAAPDVAARGGDTIKSILLGMIVLLRLQRNGNILATATAVASDPNNAMTLLGLQQNSTESAFAIDDLNQLSLAELQKILQQEWSRSGTILSAIGNATLRSLMLRLKNYYIDDSFSKLGESKLAKLIAKKIHDLPDFNKADNFDKVTHIGGQAEQLAALFTDLDSREETTKYEQQYLDLFNGIDFTKSNFDILHQFFSQMRDMPQREHLGILQAFFALNATQQLDVVRIIHRLDAKGFPTSYIVKLIKTSGEVGPQAVNEFINDILLRYDETNDDPLLRWMLGNEAFNFATLKQIAAVTKNSNSYRGMITTLLKEQDQKNNLATCLDTLQAVNPLEKTSTILEMLARSYLAEPEIKRKKIDVNAFIGKLDELNPQQLASLYNFYQKNTPGAQCLYDRLKEYQGGDFDEFLLSLEKAPFGKRNFKEQFDITQVERVVNAFVDKSNMDRAYTYSYRKQLLEAFIFVNSAGNDLQIYNNKSAKDLSNQQIQDLILEIRAARDLNIKNRFSQMSRMQRSLYALVLMREAMYRATGQFPYSTQILGLIDCIMHEGDVISNIDTGQGKSLIDTMKASILWLDSDRVDVSTSSIIDAKRDIEIYSPFLKLCGVQHASKAISSDTEISDYCVDGVNYSTLAQLALFSAKVKGCGTTVGKPDDRVSLVLNESDYSILDDKTIYRYASTIGADLGRENEWIYSALNQFVKLDWFMANDTSVETDLLRLRRHLRREAMLRKKDSKILGKFSEKQLITWLESAILTNYRLHPDFDYVLTKIKEEKIIRKGEEPRPTLLVKVLMQDKRVSHDTKFGNGVHQLICAKINDANHNEDFAIEPESKTIISLNNRNMIDSYRNKHGFIWGSSGTVGNSAEVQLQYENYGFEFSKLEAHQQKQIKLITKPVCANETEQFAKLIKLLRKDLGKATAQPALVFFKDIATAERFYAELKRQTNGQNMQLFTGLGDEEHIIQEAAKPGMITVTTAALGRNTDIKYNKLLGMTVYQTFVDTFRKTEQRSGRTGRQGSKGTVYEVLNQQDFPGKTPDQARADLEKAAKLDREHNEKFYNILYVFYSQAELLPQVVQTTAFYTTKWASFSTSLEDLYREKNPQTEAQKANFIKSAVTKFNLMLDSCMSADADLNAVINNLKLTEQAVKANLNQKYEFKPKHALYAKALTMQDCMPAHIYAYKYLNAAAGDTLISEAEVKAKLKAVFKSNDAKQFSNLNYEYIKYLSSGTQMAAIRTWHQQALTEFLHEANTKSKTTNKQKSWRNNAGHLNSIVSNENYLLLFKALCDVPGTAISNDNIKVVLIDSICSLIDEYLKHGLFISACKRLAMETLSTKIKSATNLADIIAELSKVKLEVIQQDIDQNNLRWYKRPKAVNLSGHSRLQTTLDNALALTAAVSSQDVEQNFLNDLNDKLSTSTNRTTAVTDVDSLDAFKLKQSLFHYRDRQKNAAVIARSMETALKRKPVEVRGMVGRTPPKNGGV